MRQYAVMSLCGWLLLSCGWFCLWVIASYFTLDAELAVFLFPFALRTGILLHCPKKYWPVVYASEWSLMLALAPLVHNPLWLSALVASLLSVALLWFAQRFYFGTQLRRLGVMGAVILLSALINFVVSGGFDTHGWMVVLVTITGGVMLVPSCYLVWSYLFQQAWVPLTVGLVSRPVSLRIRHILFYAVLFVVSIILQLGLPEEMRRFAPFCLAIPIILLAFRYGWQGALLGTLLNSVVLIAARGSSSDLAITDLMLSLTAQSLTGILLGMGIQRQRELNQKLRQQLTRNHSLSQQLVRAEESVRRDIARELHDEIGQNITAIRTQASIIKRVDSAPVANNCAAMIETLSLNIYDTTKGLLTQLRPKSLDDMGLKAAIEQLLRDFECEAQGIEVDLHWEGEMEPEALEDTLSVTLYRLCQETINNAIKYAQASRLNVLFVIDKEWVSLEISDNGRGFSTDLVMQKNSKGFGLTGMRERVEALGGVFGIRSYTQGERRGTHLTIRLPII
ncbi:histidine kinase [Photobacterium aquae]|uniref:Oxygen sensor histidine kinase NreB n=1 Tax=Photobacterium aquae TaxID=1195763 RepID=A0A0J1GYU5_9GAMM|nr:signal transduction histidine-protein kinase/phosphatase UhpB [Photobacterium aquae]KLV04811.1 histidine kinase [Photobacterium aquae]